VLLIRPINCLLTLLAGYRVCSVKVVFSQKLRPVRFRGKIEFRDVKFRFPTDLRKVVLNGISFVVEPGQKVALVGSTGCGKSTCMQLLQRLYEPLEGQILIDDNPIEAYDINYLRSRIVIVDQHTVLFNASVRIRYTASKTRRPPYLMIHSGTQ
jgi:ABC-type multidrug transport system fused ATPase/permease subunit